MSALMVAMTAFFGFLHPVKAGSIPDDMIFWSSPDFEISAEDLRMYLNPSVSTDGDVLWGTGDQVRGALEHLYVLNVLAAEADKEKVFTPEERRWVGEYAIAMRSVERLLYRRAMEMMASLDWEQAAREYFIAHRDEFVEPERRRVRALLFTTDNRTIEEAEILASQLAANSLNEETFRSVVLEHSEDPTGGDGLIEDLTRGQTVPEFEEAAFSLSDIGEISAPVASQFGIHVIQLLGIEPEKRKSFDEVKEALIDDLKQQKWDEFQLALRDQPRRTPPENLVEYQENLDAVINLAEQQTRDQRSGDRRALLGE